MSDKYQFSTIISSLINFSLKSALTEEQDINIIKKSFKISFMDIRLVNLNKTIINCKKCPRLVKFINKISTIKRNKILMKFTGKTCYWLWKLGLKVSYYWLAPAAHGGTRTGRAFTGDKSGDFLFNAYIKLELQVLLFQKI